MSAETPKRVVRAVPLIVPPEPVSDRSIIENVTGFINEVTLSVPPINEKEQIQWVRFETSADVSNPCFGEDYDLETGIPPPLLLILGYGNGIQIWAIPANGEATEVLSWRHGIVRCLKMLPTPIASYAIDNVNETNDLYAQKRPLMAICESSQMTSTGPQFCTMNIISLRDGDSVKSIKFKTPILEIVANHQAVVVSFAEKIAVFDARTFEDRLTITTCYPSPGLSSNPIALGSRWLAYAERKLVQSKRSAGGCDCDGVSSYTATVLNAAKTLGKGLRELGEQVAAGLTGTGTSGTGLVNMASNTAVGNEAQQMNSGIVTVLDIKYPIKETSPAGTPITTTGNDPFIAHFIAHTDVVVSMTFDASGLMLLTADKRGHDFHVFRLHPHPCGSASASVHHLYILHRGDTTAKVQDMIFSLDSRWIAVTTARGTTHVFAISPYGGATTYRTHGSAEVVNRLSRFHRSAGLSADGRSSSPILHTESGSISADPYHNNRLPPFTRPYVVMPLKQLRQPFLLSGNPQSISTPASGNTMQRQRQSSVSDDSGNVFKVCAIFGRARDWLIQPTNTARDMPTLRNQQNAVDSLFVMAGHGSMIQYDLEPRYASSVPATKQNDDSPIELHVEAKAQWSLLRKDISLEIQPPLTSDNCLLKNRMETLETATDDTSDADERWLSQVEIVTSSGPHRRLWMGPQFIFKTYNTPSGSTLQHIDSESVEVGVNCPANRPARTNPMQMPAIALGRGDVPVLIESGSASSFEQSPRFMNQYQEYMGTDELTIVPAETQLREDLADAMRESPRDSGLSPSNQTSSSTLASSARTAISIAKRVNPLGTVTTITESPRESILATDEFTEEYSSGAYIHENCDESLFRPYVAVISGTIDGEMEVVHEKPEPIGQTLIVPVIDVSQMPQPKQRISDIDRQQAENAAKFEEMRLMSRSKDDDKKEIKRKSNEIKTDKSHGKENPLKGRKNVGNSDSSDQRAQIEDKPAERMKSPEKKPEKDDGDASEVASVNVKLKKKASKNVAKLDEPLIEPDEMETKCEEQNIKTEEPVVEITMKKAVDPEKSEIAAPKRVKSRKKSLIESSSTSKESSVEKEMSPIAVEEGTKSKKKKQKNKKLLLMESTADNNTSSSESNKGDTNTELDPYESKMVENITKDEFSLLEQIGDVDNVQCAAIQESLLKQSVTVRSIDTSVQDEEISVKPSEKNGKKKKKSSKESIDNEPMADIIDNITDVTYQKPFESMADLDNLSFKSSIDDDQSALAQLETSQTNEDKAFDIDTTPMAEYSDCNNFHLVIDEPEPYVQISDQNSSDDTEDSSQSKSARSSDKICDDDDEELQPLICSPTSDTAVDTSKSDSLPNDEPNPIIESASLQKTIEQNQQQPQKQTNNSNNNKKKIRKKRR